MIESQSYLMERRKRNSNEGVICGWRQVETVMSEGNVDETKDSRNWVIMSVRAQDLSVLQE